jgi:hypothetical protein
MKKLIDWLLSSNRYKHLGLGFVYGLGANDTYCAAYGGVGVSLALEWKDGQWGGKPDWVDALLTFVGVMAGYGARYLVLQIV